MEFDIKCVTQKAIKGQAIAEFLADHSALPLEKEEALFGSGESPKR